ncbi:MAG TPA: hypothetical protein VG722_10950 [Tepidisphaeraceae bacterium]|nr:hypothetical protein [Tepidisphaeraceae bacterium]
MFEEPNESPAERSSDPVDQAKEKSDEFRMHSEFAAVFEAVRKFDAAVRPLDADLARHIQRTMAKMEKSRPADLPVVSEESAASAIELLSIPKTRELPTNDYHVYSRPGETMMVRWLEGEEVEMFYIRMQAHFDAALEQYKEEERQTHEWRQDPQTLAYLTALDAIHIQMADRYLREMIRTHKLFVLSTQSADELDILHLCDYVMGVDPASIVGAASAPPESPTEKDRAWFFKLFSLRGIVDEVERMCFFAYLQKSDDTEW